LMASIAISAVNGRCVWIRVVPSIVEMRHIIMPDNQTYEENVNNVSSKLYEYFPKIFLKKHFINDYPLNWHLCGKTLL
jgi:hypothetical protein